MKRGAETKTMNTPNRQQTAERGAPEAVNMGPQQIVIADRGWVYVGKARNDGDRLVVENARCIRRWGTTRGLGQLAETGPTSDTTIDPMGLLVIPMRAVIGILACKREW